MFNDINVIPFSYITHDNFAKNYTYTLSHHKSQVPIDLVAEVF